MKVRNHCGREKSQRHSNNNNSSNYNFYCLLNGYHVLAIVTACFISRHYEIDLIVAIKNRKLRFQALRDLPKDQV